MVETVAGTTVTTDRTEMLPFSTLSAPRRTTISQEKILPELPQLFPPPLFTLDHPAFAHLASVATAESKKLCDSAEEALRMAVHEKHLEVQAAETKLQQDIKHLWTNFNLVARHSGMLVQRGNGNVLTVVIKGARKTGCGS